MICIFYLSNYNIYNYNKLYKYNKFFSQSINTVFEQNFFIFYPFFWYIYIYKWQKDNIQRLHLNIILIEIKTKESYHNFMFS